MRVIRYLLGVLSFRNDLYVISEAWDTNYILLAWVPTLGKRVLRYLRELLSLGDACLQGQGKNEKA